MMSPKIDISYTATKSQRNRSDCFVKVLCNDSDYNGGQMKNTINVCRGINHSESYKQRRVGYAADTGPRARTTERHARPESQGTLDMAEQKLVKLF